MPSTSWVLQATRLWDVPSSLSPPKEVRLYGLEVELGAPAPQVPTLILQAFAPLP